MFLVKAKFAVKKLFLQFYISPYNYLFTHVLFYCTVKVVIHALFVMDISIEVYNISPQKAKY